MRTTFNKNIRPLNADELGLVVNYFHSASNKLLVTMGVEKSKLLPVDEWTQLLLDDFDNEPTKKKFYFVGWEYEGQLIGHSNINKIEFGKSAMVHIHIWNQTEREKGLGTWFFKQSINHYFEVFRLAKIVCEPCAENPAPNKVLQRLGCEIVKTYETIPGWINFKQFVNRYEITSHLM